MKGEDDLIRLKREFEILSQFSIQTLLLCGKYLKVVMLILQ